MRTFIEAERGASCRLGRYSNLLTFLQSVFSLEVYSWVLCASPNENYKTYHLCRNEVAYSILYQVGLLLKDSTLRAFPLAPVLRAANHRRMASAVPDDRTYNRTSPVVPGRTRDVLQCPGRSFFFHALPEWPKRSVASSFHSLSGRFGIATVYAFRHGRRKAHRTAVLCMYALHKA